MLTRSAAGTALAIGHGGISTGDQRAGDFAAHSSRVLHEETVVLVQE